MCKPFRTTVSLAGVLLLAVLAGGAPPPVPSPAGSVSPTGSMTLGRSGHTATRLGDGRVLIAGGMLRNGEFLADAELYDPATGKFTALTKMTERRVSHTATLLRNGKVLIAGGIEGRFMQEGHWTGRVLASGELFDPATGTFTPTGSMNVARNSQAAVLLTDGKVLILGGSGGGDWRELHASAEIYDPATGRFTPTGSMATPRTPHAVALLNDGRVLVAGGTGPNRTVLASAEIYDPAAGRFSATGNLLTARHKHAAALLPDGRVLIVGGSDERDWDGQLATAEIFDPATRRFTSAGRMAIVRFKLQSALVRLPDGRVLIAGGGDRAEVFDPKTGSFTPAAGSLEAPWHFSTATLLTNGRVLIAGGYPNSSEGTNRAWIYQP